MRKTIFVVDDDDINLFLAAEVLKHIYNVITIPSAQRMFALLEKIVPSLILLDIQMPEMDGFEALKLIKSNDKYKNIPVVFLTALHDPEVEIRGFESGALDFIVKPFSTPVLLNRIRLQIDVNELISIRTAQLEERTAKLEQYHRSIMMVLSDVVENRDQNTGGHIERTTRYIKILAEALIERDVCAYELSAWDLDVFSAFALLHDVGKIGVSDLILNKPGKLTEQEFEVMKNHVQNGERIIDQVIARTGDNTFLNNAKLFALYHHENWDGTGYPYGLKGEKIPIQGRIMAIADVYDALISKRPYKKGLTHQQAVDIMMKDSGKRFDPRMMAVFLEISDKFYAVAASYWDYNA